MRGNYPLAIFVATGALFVTTTPLRASETDDRIESSARKSRVFKTCLMDDAITLRSKDGIVTRLVTGLNGVESVINNMTPEAAVSKSDSRPRPEQKLRNANNLNQTGAALPANAETHPLAKSAHRFSDPWLNFTEEQKHEHTP